MEQEYKYLELTIQYVFRANFNDSYYLETLYLDLNDLDKDELVWFDPYNGRSKINETLIALKKISKNTYMIYEKAKKEIKERKVNVESLYICAEDYDSSMLLSTHINFRKEKRY